MKLRQTDDGYVEIHPKPSRAELHAYYNDKYYGDRQGSNQYSFEYTAEELEHKGLPAAEAERYAKTAGVGSLLEVGVGEGFVLNYFAQRGWKVRGMDFTSAGIEAFFPQLREYVVTGDVYDALDAEVEAGATYDMVICNHVLEHVLDPPALLRKLHRVVSETGICRVQVPNDGSWLQKEVVANGFAKPDYWVCPPDHLSYFTPPSLRRLATRCGWEVEDLLAGFPIDLALLNPDSCYTMDPSRGRNCHFARVAFEMGLWRQSLDALIAFRRGCAQAGVGRTLVAYLRRPT